MLPVTEIEWRIEVKLKSVSARIHPFQGLMNINEAKIIVYI